jgi:hypothetical protein
MINEIEYMDLAPARKNISDVLLNIDTMIDWLEMAKNLVNNGRRDDAMKVSLALKKKTDIIDRLMKKIPAKRLEPDIKFGFRR